MSAPRQRKPGLAAPLVYKRPEQTYFAVVGGTAEERLATLRATLREAEEKIEAAYDAVERGTAVDTLLHLIGHDLLCDAMRPEIMGADGAPSPNRADLDEAYTALFPVLASLEGAMALSMGTVINSTLVDAYNLLDWAQNECDSAALGKLLPVFDPDAAFNRGRDLAIEMLVKADESGHRREGWRRFREGQKQENIFESVFDAVVDDSTLLPGFCAVMSATMRNDGMDLAVLKTITLAEIQAGKPGDDGTEADADAADDDATAVATVACTSKPKAEWLRLDLIDGDLNNAEIMNDMINDACQFSYDDAGECELAQGRIILLSRAVDGYILKARTELQAATLVAQKAGRDHE